MEETPQQETPAETLARSAFGFAFVAFMTAFITWGWLLLSTPSPDPTFEKIRTTILVGFGLFVVALLWVNIYFYRTPPERLHPASERIADLFCKKWLALALSIVLVEINILAFQLLVDIAPAITAPGKFLLAMWSLLVLGMMLTVNRERLGIWLDQTQNMWVGMGLFVVVVALVGLLFAVSLFVVELTGINDRLRGGLDYRPLTFFEDGQPTPTASAFWQEQSQTRRRWSPYTYWVLEEFHGEFINVDGNGLRQTPDFSTSESKEIFVFGGSTVWGEGARDAYTIPGHLARLLNEIGTPQHIMNFGQTGYVSTQDLIWFQLQLSSGNIPDAAIFYQGFNDVLSGWQQDRSGVFLQANVQASVTQAGRTLLEGQPVLRLPDVDLHQYDLSLASVGDSSAEQIAERWLANVDMIEALGAAYDVETVFVWQPAIIYKSPLTATEQAIVDRWESERTGLFDLYMDVDTIIRQRATEYDTIVILSDLFAENDETLFHDLVHITENGNALVAEALLPILNNILEK